MNTEYALPPTAARALAEFKRPAGPVHRLIRRLRAIARLVARRRRAQRWFDDLRHLDERTLRDLGIRRSELASVVSELGGRAAATRRRTDLEVWQSASSRFRLRAIDSSL
jgi:uncharacterized protein YjiS (DUF1127 family)